LGCRNGTLNVGAGVFGGFLEGLIGFVFAQPRTCSW
jgi:hypothetical protein